MCAPVSSWPDFRPLAGALILLALILLVGGKCAVYLIQAGCGQASILWNRQPIAEMLKDPALDPEVRRKLLLVEEVREFGRTRIGLKVEGTYTKMTKIDRSAVAYNVTASRELAFESRTWWFPIVGRVPYLGYFEKSRAEKLAAELASEGWDVRVQDVSAYSTLGWFNDPLISTQLKLSDTYLTELVLHESTHATLWFPGDVDFNESFASFVDERAAMQFFREKEGADSEMNRRRTLRRTESAELRKMFHKAAEELDAAYRSRLTDNEKRVKKKDVIAEFQRNLMAHASDFKAINLRAVAEHDYNNADFLAHRRYESGSTYFEDEFRACEEKWDCFFQKMQELRAKSADERRGLLRPSAKRPGAEKQNDANTGVK